MWSMGGGWWDMGNTGFFGEQIIDLQIIDLQRTDGGSSTDLRHPNILPRLKRLISSTKSEIECGAK